MQYIFTFRIYLNIKLNLGDDFRDSQSPGQAHHSTVQLSVIAESRDRGLTKRERKTVREGEMLLAGLSS